MNVRPKRIRSILFSLNVKTGEGPLVTKLEKYSLVKKDIESGSIRSYIEPNYEVLVDIYLEWKENGSCSTCLDKIVDKLIRRSDAIRTNLHRSCM